MLHYAIRRLAAIVPLLIVITSLTFLLGQYGSGDLAAYITMQQSGGQMDLEVYQALREELGLDDPPHIRYFRWLQNAVRGDLGRSYIRLGQPDVIFLIKRALPITLELAFASLVTATIVGIPLGILAAVIRNSVLDYVIVGSSTVLTSIPGFVLAPIAMLLLVIKFDILPSVGLGWHGMFSEKSLLPILTLAASVLLPIVRYTRQSVLEVLSQEYVRAARAKGMPEWQIITRHVVKNAFIPIATILGLVGAALVSGSLFIEIIFNLQGFGSLAAEAMVAGDIQTSTGVLLVSALLVMLINLLVDLMYGVFDPRVQFKN